MKRTLLFLFCALISTQMFSETLFGYLFPTLAYLERTSCHYMEGNEQNRTLNRLSFEDNMFEIDGNYYIEYNGFWLREDKEGRILVYSEPAKKDLVLYDFTLEIGDTLTTLNVDQVPMTEGDPILPGVKPVVVDYPIHLDEYVSFPIDTLIVTDVSMVMMCDSNQYKKWTFSNGMEYMEYIGNLGADFFAIIRNPWEELPTCCVEEDLVCASIYDRLVYLMDDEKRDLLNIDCPCTSWSNKWQWRTNTWNVLQFDGIAFEQTAQTWQYELAHDTIIGGKEYTAVTRHWTAYDESAAEYVAAVRFAENKKAFIYYDNAEYLLYDFGYHEIGDTLEVFSGINNYMHFKTYKCVITDNYSTAGGIAEDTYVMDIIHPITGDTIPSALVWQEFVGSYSGFLHGGLLVPGNSNYQLLCAYKDNVLAYSVDNDAFTDNDTFIEYGCEYNAEQKPKDLFPTLWGLRRTHTIEMYDYAPNDGKRNGGYPELTAPTKDTIIDGKTYLQFDEYYSSLFLREENNKVLIYSSMLQEDLVLYDYTLGVGDSLHAITGDDWFSDANFAKLDKAKDIFTYVVTEVSTITLIDGIERKKWTLQNQYLGIMEYVEGIGCFGEKNSHSGDFFRLIENHPYVTESIGNLLVCVSQNGQLLYSMSQHEMESFVLECQCLSQSSYKDQWCDTWNIMEHNVQLIGDYNEETWRHYLAEDTTINGTTYTTVNRYWTADKTKRGFVATIRFTEDQKVYALLGDTEYLVYDFSVQVGDTIETIVGVNCGTMLQQLLVHQVDIDDATNRKTITLYPLCQLEEDVDCDRCDENGYYLDLFPIQWIEGVGSTDGFLMGDRPCSDWVGGIGHKLLCAYKDDELQYINDLYQDDYGCEYNTVEQNPENLFPTLWGLQRTICNEYCEDSKTSLQKFEDILFEHDKPYIYCESAFLIREENNKILIYSHSLDKDLVLYDFTLEVGDSLPRLYLDESAEKDLYWIDYSIMNVVDYHKDLEGNILPVDTLIVTDVSTITLLDGKEHKKWTFNNGMEYVEGIGSFGNNMWFWDFFQLIGNTAFPVSLHGTHLVCVSKNGKLLYQMDDAEMERLGTECLCDYDRGPRKDNAKDGQIGGRPTPTQWNQLELDLREMENGTTILRAETFSYTLEDISQQVNNKTYFQLARQSTKDTATTKSVVGALHFGKDEDNRVYFLRDGVEYILYDFTAEIGDTVEIFAGINNYPQETTYTHVVVDKDTTEDGACRMFLEVVFPEETTTAENAEKVWLAGLGSVDGIVHNAAKRTSNAHAAPSRSASSETESSVMLCAWREDSCLYTTDHPDYETFGCVYNQDPTEVESPTSSSSYQKVLRGGQLLIMHNGKIYTVMGIEMK